MKSPRRKTIVDPRARKGRRQLSMFRVATLNEAVAAQPAGRQAGIDLRPVPPALLTPAFRKASHTCFAIPGLEYGDFITPEDYLRAEFAMMRASADAVDCAAGMAKVRRLRDEGIPVCAPSGLIPSQATWTGGFKAVGKTAETAMLVWNHGKSLEAAGAFAAEIEVEPGADLDRHGRWRRRAVPVRL